MPYIVQEFKQFHISSKTIFYVDEEFVGGNDNQGFACFQQKMAHIYHTYGFSFETSSRIDQVYTEKKSKEYTIERW